MPSVLDANSTDLWSPTVRVANQHALAKIESQVAAIAAKLRLREEISVAITTKKPPARYAQTDFEYEAVESLVKFPGRSAHETWRLSKITKVPQPSYS